MKRATITDYDLVQFCRFYSKQFGAVQDATRFKNELSLRYYWHTQDSNSLYQRCIKLRLFVERGGNIIFKIDGRDNRQ